MICIIPARGGSKRLPRKNILEFRGKPLILHVIKNALESRSFEKIIVSSEDPEILEVASKTNVILNKRKECLASDSSTVVEVCLDVLSTEETNDFCCIYPTSVLLQSKTIGAAVKAFNNYKECECSVLMGVSEYKFHPVQALSKNDNGYWETLYNQFKDKRSQLYPHCKVSNGTLYIARTKTFHDEKTFYSKKLQVFDIPDGEVSDIDTPSDYEILKKIQ